MIKYIVLIILFLVGGLLFLNKDRILSQYSNYNQANTSAAYIANPSKNIPVYSDKKSVQIIATSTTQVIATSTTLYKLSALRLLGAANRPKGDDNGPIIRTSFTGKGTVTGAGKYNKGVRATLTAVPDKNSKVIWSNMCSGSNNTCNILMNSDKEVHYAFVPKGNGIRDIFKKCTLVPFYNPITKTTEVTMSCNW